MRLSEKYAVPRELALLYDFVNSLDRRSYVEHGDAHAGGDELANAEQFKAWIRARGLAGASREDHRQALQLRETLRAFLKLPAHERTSASHAVAQLNALAAALPLDVAIDRAAVKLRPHADANGLAQVLAQLYELAVTGRLVRLKMCDSPECEWIFFDRSKPANRRWCSSSRCGNREKTRSYRARQRGER